MWICGAVISIEMVVMMRNVLILGGFGFVGTNIIKYIDAHVDNMNVVVLDRFPEHRDCVNFTSVSRIYAGDFSDKCLMERIFEENRIDMVIHCLSASVPTVSLDNEFDILHNVMPTIQLLDRMVQYGVHDIVFISSGGAVYGDCCLDNDGHVETEQLFPKSAYGISKLVIEKYLYLYAMRHGVKSLVLRLSNPYGPYHYSKKQGVINVAMEKAIMGEPFVIWGDGNGRKDYIYVEDFCAILMLLIDKWDGAYAIVNVGSGCLLSVNEIVGMLKKVVNSSFVWSYVDANVCDVQNFKLNLSLLQSLIGKFRYTSIVDGVQKTYEWYMSR